MTSYLNSAVFAADLAETLDPLSFRVVQLARSEAVRSGPRRGVLGRAWQWFLNDVDVPRPLANPRLDLLRRFSMLVWFGDAESEELAQVMVTKGHYSAGQLDMVRVLSRA
jgi:hypothetical protein